MRVQTPQSETLHKKLQQSQQVLMKPEWLKIRPPSTEKFSEITTLLKAKRLNTVCAEAHCPNISECWSGGTATFMLMGDTCTRACRFCMVKSGNPKGLLDKNEPRHLVEAVKIMKLNYIVLTCVTRDDLPDGGASHFAICIKELKKAYPQLLVEVLISDLNGNEDALKVIVEAQPTVLAHNMETVERLQGTIRDPRANYQKSLSVLKNAKKIFTSSLDQKDEKGGIDRKSVSLDDQKKTLPLFTKTSLMLGLGEKKEEVVQTMKDLRKREVDIITFGQYLRPSPYHIAVHEYITPDQFADYQQIAKQLGFLYCASGPLVRSSYRAGELFLKNLFTS